MVFSSFVFLCFFLPVVYVLHALIPHTGIRNWLLVIASLLFYTYGEPIYILLLLVSVTINYVSGCLLAKKKDKRIIIVSSVINIGLLVVFKYAGFLAEGLNLLLPEALEVPVPALRLPIGISFYTFQAMSYVIDVYRDEAEVQKNYFHLLLYVLFFPQLIAGPIVKYHDVAEQITNRQVTVEGTKRGIYRFSCGLGKKILISNAMAYVADTMFALGNDEVGLLAAWVGALAYCIQIYFDFSGYSDMAIGLGHMFGFYFLENFNYPYISGSIQEFWRRWHISLSTWFKEYLYIPLGGNRKGKRRTMINRYIVFLATGIWHGANWTFLLWGLWHGTFLVLEQFGIIPIKKCRFKPVTYLYTLLVVLLGFVLFRADTLTQAGYFLKALFGFGASGGIGYAMAVQMLSPYYLFIFVISLVGATPLPKLVWQKLATGEKRANIMEVVAMVLCFAVLLLSFMALAANSYNPFIYFRF